ncbi:hypothetical protein BLA29_007843 [Euroglyphus maynei]|uniref:Uncharacterized protein n=1 Tax=Euroglyphus maynei TaxID=6958 RepID=A0A1Y3BG05_EURMA|nr:hypothetical protein BLA29_007843 [Euroglyphus maynei]
MKQTSNNETISYLEDFDKEACLEAYYTQVIQPLRENCPHRKTNYNEKSIAKRGVISIAYNY